MDRLLFMLTHGGTFGIILRVAVSVAWSCLWGFLTNKVIRDKGYSTNWFLWGFFFGVIALFVALLRPAHEYETWDEYQSKKQEAELNEKLLAKGGWECQCGKVNASYVDTCTCGTTRGEMYKPPQ